jgi:hypothetical protein
MFLRFILPAFVTPIGALHHCTKPALTSEVFRFQSLDLSMIRPCFQGLQMYRKQPSIPDKNLVFWGYFFHFGG